MAETEALVTGSRGRGRDPGCQERFLAKLEHRRLAAGHKRRKRRGTHAEQSPRKCDLEGESQGERGHRGHPLLSNWDDKA